MNYSAPVCPRATYTIYTILIALHPLQKGKLDCPDVGAAQAPSWGTDEDANCDVDANLAVATANMHLNVEHMYIYIYIYI